MDDKGADRYIVQEFQRIRSEFALAKKRHEHALTAATCNTGINIFVLLTLLYIAGCG